MLPSPLMVFVAYSTRNSPRGKGHVPRCLCPLHPTMPLLHPTSPVPALPLFRPPKSLLSDRVGTGGDTLGQLLPAQVGSGGLFRGVRSTLAARKAPATFPDPHHTRRLLLPH